MELRKYRWSKTYESAEEELTHLLQVKRITSTRIVLEPHETLGPTQPQADSRIWCAEGSLAVTTGSKRYSLQPGDALDIPAHTNYEILAGLSGCAIHTTDAPY